jgi:hypothetical protein
MVIGNVRHVPVLMIILMKVDVEILRLGMVLLLILVVVLIVRLILMLVEAIKIEAVMNCHTLILVDWFHISCISLGDRRGFLDYRHGWHC